MIQGSMAEFKTTLRTVWAGTSSSEGLQTIPRDSLGAEQVEVDMRQGVYCSLVRATLVYLVYICGIYIYTHYTHVCIWCIHTYICMYVALPNMRAALEFR